jgi:hypothetical protein
VFIIYQGRAAGRRAKYFYENLVRDLRGKYYVNPDLWNFPILAISQIGNLASQVASKADVVILSLSGDACASVQTIISCFLCTVAGFALEAHRSNGRPAA